MFQFNEMLAPLEAPVKRSLKFSKALESATRNVEEASFAAHVV
jgi:hypothetical protein